MYAVHVQCTGGPSPMTMNPAQRSSTAVKPFRRARALATGGAAAAALCVWAGARLAGLDLTVRMGADATVQQVGPAAVAMASVLAALAGWGLLAALERFTSRAREFWIILALGVLAISLTGPLGVTAST